MVNWKEDPYFYRAQSLLEVVGPMGRGPQVVSGSEWVSRCGGGRYKRGVSGRGQVIVYWAAVSSLFEDV